MRERKTCQEDRGEHVVGGVVIHSTAKCGREILPIYERCVIHDIRKLDGKPFRPGMASRR